MTKFIPLVSNVENIEKGKKAQDHEISIAVLASEIHLEDLNFMQVVQAVYMTL